MGPEAYKALVRQFYEEVWDRGNVAFANRVFHDDYVRHDLRPSNPLPGAEGQGRIAADFRRAFPDLRFSVDLILGEGELVAARWTATGTHQGDWGGIAPTGRRVTFSGVNLFRFRGDRVAEIWNHRDDLGLATQVGASIYAGAAPTEPT